MKLFIVALSTLLVLSAVLRAQAPVAANRAVAARASAGLTDSEGRSVGQAFLQETPHGVLVRLELTHVTPGVHGLHIHGTGRCDRPSFDSAGGHFNPDGRVHGFLTLGGPHAGDLPNVYVPSTAELSVEYLLPNLTLQPGPRSLLDSDGSALVMHAGKDDYLSDPAGNSGMRLLCGVIVGSQLNASRP